MAGGVNAIIDAVKEVQSILDDGQEHLEGGLHLRLCMATKNVFEKAEAFKASVSEAILNTQNTNTSANAVVRQVEGGTMQYEELAHVLLDTSAAMTHEMAIAAIDDLVENYESVYWREAIDKGVVSGLLAVARNSAISAASTACKAFRALQTMAENCDDEFKTKLFEAGCVATVTATLMSTELQTNLKKCALDLLIELTGDHESNMAMTTALGFIPMLLGFISQNEPALLRVTGLRLLHVLVDDNQVNCTAACGSGAVKKLVELLDPNAMGEYCAISVINVLRSLVFKGGETVSTEACGLHGAMPKLARIVKDTRETNETKDHALCLIAQMCPYGVGFAAQLHADDMVKKTVSLLQSNTGLSIQTSAAMALGSFAVHAAHTHLGDDMDPFPEVVWFRAKLRRAIPTLVQLIEGPQSDTRSTACLRALANFSAVNSDFRDEIARCGGATLMTTELTRPVGAGPYAKNKRSYAAIALNNMAMGGMEPDVTKRKRCAFADVEAGRY